VNFATTVIVARVYGLDGMGAFALAAAPAGLAWYLSTVREQAALVRELSSLPARAPRVTGLFAAVLVFSTALTALICVAATPVVIALFEGPIGRPELIAPALAGLAGYVLFTNPGWNFDSVFAAFVAGRDLFWIRLHQSLAFPIIATAIGLWWQDVWGLVIGTAAASATSLVHRAIVARRYMRFRVPWAEVRAGFATLPILLKFGVKAAPGTVAYGISFEIGTWILGATTTLGAVGAYNRATMLGRRLLELNYRISEMLLPTLVQRRAADDRHGFDRAVAETTRYACVLLLLIAAAAGGAAESVMSMFGPGFDQASVALALLLLMPVIATAGTVQSNVLYALDRPLPTTVAGIACMVVTVTLTFALAPPLGIDGVALAVLAGVSADLLWKLVATRRHLTQAWSVLWPWRERAALLAAYPVAFAAAHVVDAALPGIAGLVPAGVVGVVTYVATFVICGGLRPSDRARLAEGRARVLRRRSSIGAAALDGSG
jgi:O-antigen/teichoic acid export membrane protein